MNLTAVMFEYLDQRGPGMHRISEGIDWIEKRCAELGIQTTREEIQREFRDVAGYP